MKTSKDIRAALAELKSDYTDCLNSLADPTTELTQRPVIERLSQRYQMRITDLSVALKAMEQKEHLLEAIYNIKATGQHLSDGKVSAIIENAIQVTQE